MTPRIASPINRIALPCPAPVDAQPQPDLASGLAGGVVAGVVVGVVAGVVAAPAALTSISGMSTRTSSASRAWPRGANARSRAGFTPVVPATPLGGPPQRPRTGASHLIGPVHTCRIA